MNWILGKTRLNQNPISLCQVGWRCESTSSINTMPVLFIKGLWLLRSTKSIAP